MLTIQQLQQLTTLKAATIRIWEQRYAPFSPARTSTNQRLYEELDIIRALYLTLLTRRHYNISEIATCSLPELEQRARPVLANAADPVLLIDQLLLAVLERKFSAYSDQLVAAVKTYGGYKAVEQIVLPLLSRLQGLGGQALTGLNQGAVALTQLGTLLNEWTKQLLPPRQPTTSRYLLFLPAGETQPIYLQLAHYLLASQGCQATYLDTTLTEDELPAIYQAQQPTHLVSWLTQMPHHRVQPYVDKLAACYPKVHLLLGGERVVGQDLVLLPQVRLIHSVLELAQ